MIGRMTEDTEAAPKKKRRKKPCARCGDFARTAKLGDRRLCAACLDREEAWVRARPRVGSILTGAFHVARLAGLRFFAVILALYGAMNAAIMGFFLSGSSLPFEAVLLAFVAIALGITIWGQVLLILVVDGELRGGSPGMLALLDPAMSWLPRYGWASLRAFVSIFGWTLIFVVPGIARAGRLALVGPITVLEGAPAEEALLRSEARTAQGWGSFVIATWLVLAPIGALNTAIQRATAPVAVSLGVLTVIEAIGYSLPAACALAFYYQLRWQEARGKLEPVSSPS